MYRDKILVTGASGFVGRALVHECIGRKLNVRAASRNCTFLTELVECLEVGEINSTVDWLRALEDCDTVVHLAARAHVLNDNSKTPALDYHKVNVEGTLNLAMQAASRGVRRFVYLSSIKVNGESTKEMSCFKHDDVPAPEDFYGLSKAEAEAGLRLLAAKTGMEVTIIRPPMIYGPGVKGNFHSLLVWMKSGLPLPLGSVTNNLRSFVGLTNLIDLILVCVVHPRASNQTFLVSDGEDLSTTELLKRTSKAMGRQVWLLKVNVGVLEFLAKLLGKSVVSQRLLGSLQVDMSRTCQLLDWKPLISVDEELRKTVQEMM